MRTPPAHSNGIVAILDALGAASYTDTEIDRFIESRTVVLGQLNEKAEGVLGEIRAEMIKTFTFNDTVLVILNTGSEDPTLRRISQFFMIMRKFLVDSLAKRILFRGSIAIGTFYANDDTNTVMGQAVTDAAAWYDKADWIGVHTTPRTNLVINRCLEHEETSKESVMLDYNVPLKNGQLFVRRRLIGLRSSSSRASDLARLAQKKRRSLNFSRDIRCRGVRKPSSPIRLRFSIMP